MRLVIVESPAKAKTIGKYLGREYKVLASYGHIRDLLSKNGSVKPDENFSMVWDISDHGKKCIKDITQQLKSCDELLLATDPDREGEAISWHIKEVLDDNHSLKVPFKRIVFHEITKNAILKAIETPRDIDSRLVDSYLARRALDYLVGFTLSPILWRKLPGSKSAGRVQSVALRIIAERESEIEAFKPEEFWTIEAKFENKENKSFKAKLITFEGKKLEKFSIVNNKSAESIRDILLQRQYVVVSVNKKTVNRNPAPAFITSTLQQEASRKLGFSAKKTMQIAQRLYEGVNIGKETQALITYMRTDSVNLSNDAVEIIRKVISDKYGKKFVPNKPRFYHTKVKNAQEAHEAIRPIDANIIPESLIGKIDADLLKLYTLIWRRAVASQMESAVFDQVQVDISDTKDSGNVFRATGNTIKFEGFLKVYSEGKDDNGNQEKNEDDENFLPSLAKDDETDLKNLEALQHFTSPPPRFSEASLVKKLEELGIGRPSTYATILQVLQDRGYVKLEKKYFIPEIRGRLVTSFLTNFFMKYLEYGFTADMEQSLDDVSNGNKTKLDVLNAFWVDFFKNVEQTKNITVSDVIDRLNESMKTILFKTNEDGQIDRKCPECGKGELSLKIGRYGSFIGCSNYPTCAYVRKLDINKEKMDPTVENFGEISDYPKTIGVDPNDDSMITLRKGPYGLYIQKDASVESVPPSKGKKKMAVAKPVRSSIPSFIDAQNLDLDRALWLLSLPKIIGQHNGEDIKIGIGRFGPYILFQNKYTSVKDPNIFMNMTVNDAIKIISEGNVKRGGGRKRSSDNSAQKTK
ncbi:MAG: type I DNA topoisomerase [Alphaproteobacteria bacterium]|nr:type I DNA topoisomerase [Alphaproteobacteria bacterium]